MFGCASLEVIKTKQWEAFVDLRFCFAATRGITITALGIFFVMGAAQARANDLSECRLRIIHAENKYKEALEKHGTNSNQAKDRLRQLQEERERCAITGWPRGGWTEHGNQIPSMDPHGYDYQKEERERECREERNERYDNKHDGNHHGDHGNHSEKNHAQAQQVPANRGSERNSKSDRAQSSR
jgi:hypothetical protein